MELGGQAVRNCFGYSKRAKVAKVPLVYSGTEGRSCSELLRSPTELKRRTRSFSKLSLSNVPQTPPFFNVLSVHCAIPLLTDSPSVSTTVRACFKDVLPFPYTPNPPSRGLGR